MNDCRNYTKTKCNGCEEYGGSSAVGCYTPPKPSGKIKCGECGALQDAYVCNTCTDLGD